MSCLVTGDLLEDTKFYQDVAVELQTAYDTLQKRFAQQAHLMEEASGTLHAAESQASKRQWELLKCTEGTTKPMSEQAIGEAVNWVLRAAQGRPKEISRQRTVNISKRSTNCKIKSTLWSYLWQATTTLPSVRHTQEEADLWAGGI